MQGIIFKPADISVDATDVLPVYINEVKVCDFKVESFTDSQVVGDFTTTDIEPNLQFTVMNASSGLRVVPFQ